MLAPLINIICSDCESEIECDRCGSSAEAEVCSECLEPYDVVLGQEVCGCTVALTADEDRCEFCGGAELKNEMIFGSCRRCHDEAYERYVTEMGEDGLNF